MWYQPHGSRFDRVHVELIITQTWAALRRRVGQPDEAGKNLSLFSTYLSEHGRRQAAHVRRGRDPQVALASMTASLVWYQPSAVSTSAVAAHVVALSRPGVARIRRSGHLDLHALDGMLTVGAHLLSRREHRRLGGTVELLEVDPIER